MQARSRRTVYLPANLAEWLKAEAARSGRTQSAVIADALSAGPILQQIEKVIREEMGRNGST